MKRLGRQNKTTDLSLKNEKLTPVELRAESTKWKKNKQQIR